MALLYVPTAEEMKAVYASDAELSALLIASWEQDSFAVPRGFKELLYESVRRLRQYASDPEKRVWQRILERERDKLRAELDTANALVADLEREVSDRDSKLARVEHEALQHATHAEKRVVELELSRDQWKARAECFDRQGYDKARELDEAKKRIAGLEREVLQVRRKLDEREDDAVANKRIAELEQLQSSHAAEWRAWAKGLVQLRWLDNEGLRKAIESRLAAKPAAAWIDRRVMHRTSGAVGLVTSADDEFLCVTAAHDGSKRMWHVGLVVLVPDSKAEPVAVGNKVMHEQGGVGEVLHVLDDGATLCVKALNSGSTRYWPAGSVSRLPPEPVKP